MEVTVWELRTVPAGVPAAVSTRVGQHGLEIVVAVCRSFQMHRDPVGKRITAAVALADGPIGDESGDPGRRTDTGPAVIRRSVASSAEIVRSHGACSGATGREPSRHERNEHVSGDWSAVVAAVVGVVGTLGAAFVTQSRADRTRRMELEAAHAQRREERRHAEELLRAERAEQKAQSLMDLHRSCYISLNTSMRQYMTAQVNLLHALQEGIGVDLCLEQLEACRIAQRDSFAEAEMVVPDEVLTAATAAGHRLNTGYGLLKRVSVTSPCDQEELNAFAAGVDEAWGQLSLMQKRMRQALGIESGTRGGGSG